jgi:NADH-quinone oxidoreductase subunit N
VAAQDLVVLFLGFELLSIPLYVLCATHMRREHSLESGLKYLIIGSVGSATLLYGLALVYGAAGSTNFLDIARRAGAVQDDVLFLTGVALVVAGLAFKASVAPFHQWTPDVYEGAPTPVTAFMSAATKVAAFMLAFRVLRTAFPSDAHLWTWALVAIAIASLVVGNFAALVQRNVKRMLAYSSISHAGFLLIGAAAGSPLGGRAMLYYLIPYAAMAFGSFAIVAARERELGVPATLDNLAGFGWERPFLGVAMWFFMFGFAGLPLGGGFVGKFYVFAAAYRHGWVWLVIVGVLATLVSLYYYLGIVRAMYMRPSEELQVQPAGGVAVSGGAPAKETLLHLAVGAAFVVSLGSLFAVQPLIDLARHAASALPF